MKKLLALLLAMVMLVSVIGAGVFAEEDYRDVPADRYDAAVTPREGNNASTPLVVSTGTLDGKFSPFFYTSAYDNDVQSNTQIGMIAVDKDGAPIANVDEPSLALSFTIEENEDRTESVYKFVLKKGITFSDGEPVTLKDVLFSLYVLVDPAFDGISTFYTIPIQGLEEYRRQSNTETIELVDAIIEAGLELDPAEDGSPVPVEVEGVDPADQAAFWAYMGEAGQSFAQDITDYVYANYGHRFAEFFPTLEIEDISENDTLKTALGMYAWGFGDMDEEDNAIFYDFLGNEFDLNNDTLDASVYWENIVGAYGYDLSDSGIPYEQASADSPSLTEYISRLYFANEGAVAGGVDSIAGVATGSEVGEDGIEREYIQYTLDGVDPTAIFKMGFAVAPQHYYAGDYANTNENGVVIGDPDFMLHLKSKNGEPMGAGPYIFQNWTDGVVTFEAFDDFMLGSPKIKTFRFQEIPLGNEFDSVKSGTVHYSDPSATSALVNELSSGAEDVAHLSYTLVDNDGYGYIGIQGQLFEDWNVRKAIASALNVQLAVDDYYGELASVNYRTMTKVQWAYPENPENLFPYDGTGATSLAMLEESGYVYDEAANVLYYPETHEKAGQPVTIKFTLPVSAAADHPAGFIVLDFQEVMSKIGVKVEIDLDQQLLSKLSTAYESGIEMWAAAWGSGGTDPDMFQIWYSDPDVNKADSPKRSGLTYLYENGSDDQKAALVELNELIVAGRSTTDIEERREIYARALELSTGMAVEIPTYQRKNIFVYNSDVINVDTLVAADDVTPFQGPLRNLWTVELND